MVAVAVGCELVSGTGQKQGILRGNGLAAVVGPTFHTNIKALGHFRVKSEQGISAGVTGNFFGLTGIFCMPKGPKNSQPSDPDSSKPTGRRPRLLKADSVGVAAGSASSSPQETGWDFSETLRHMTSSPPPWLASYLEAHGHFIKNALRVRKLQPGRSKLINELRALERAARLVQSYVKIGRPLRRGESGVRVLLSDRFGWHNSNSFRQMHEPLGAFIASVQAAQNSPELVDHSGNTIRGRGKPDLAARIPAEDLCALIIATLMDHFDGIQPGTRHRRAWDAAEAYWRGIGLERKARGNDPGPAWRPVFERINAEDFETERRAYSENLARWASSGAEGSEQG